jgi:hypothetical protein
MGPLVCYHLSRCTIKIPDEIVVKKVPQTAKYKNMRFSISLNIEGGDFVGKSQKSS